MKLTNYFLLISFCLGSSSTWAAGLRIVDGNGQSVAGAQVMIGNSQGSPFVQNIVTTGNDGAIPIPDSWQNSLPVTIQANGFVKTTYFARSPKSQETLVIRRTQAIQPLEVKGIASGYGPLQDDGFVHVGLVFPAIKRSEIGSFQLTSVISPRSETITVAGKTSKIPSNISLPKQSLSYLFFQVDLDKPQFRTFFDNVGTHKVVAVHARFPLSEAVDGMQAGKPFMEMINILEFLESSVRDVPVSIQGAQQDMLVNEKPFQEDITFHAPNFEAGMRGLAMVLTPASNDSFYPTDVKKMNSGESKNLKTTNAKQAQLMFVLQPNSANSTGAGSDSLSMGFQKAASTALLAIPAAPTLQVTAAGAILHVKAPQSPAGVRPAMTVATLSLIKPADRVGTDERDLKLERKIGQWDLYADGWPSSLELPQMPGAIPPAGSKLRWEAGFAAAPTAAGNLPLGPKAFDKISNFAKSAIDL